MSIVLLGIYTRVLQIFYKKLYTSQMPYGNLKEEEIFLWKLLHAHLKMV